MTKTNDNDVLAVLVDAPADLKGFAAYDLSRFGVALADRIVFTTAASKYRDKLQFTGGHAQLPAIGAQVKITFNGLGTGTVVSYFTEHSFIGVCVKLDNPPDWHTKQSKGRKSQHGFDMTGHALVFGSELQILEHLSIADRLRLRLEYRSASDIMDVANSLTNDADQDWDTGSTTWKFEDGSELTVSDCLIS